jgi:2-iminobutanoate/2-iminopropanoate deaminase
MNLGLPSLVVVLGCALLFSGLASAQTSSTSTVSRIPIFRKGGDSAVTHEKSDSEVLAMMMQAVQEDHVRIDVGAPRLKKATFSPGVKVGKLLFISGQISIDPDGNIVGRGDFAAQCKQVFENMKLVLDKAGASYSDIVKINTYLTDLREYPAFAQIRGQYFAGNYPASTVVGVTGLAFEGAMLEVEAIAVLK